MRMASLTQFSVAFSAILSVASAWAADSGTIATSPSPAPTTAPTSASAPATPSSYVRLIGTATNEDGKLVYVEEHLLTYDPDHHLAKTTTVFRRPGPDGKEIARLESDFSKYTAGFLPSYHLVDLRNQKESGLDWVTPIPATSDSEGVIEMFRKKAGDDAMKKETMKVKAGTVTEEGIFFYIIDRIQEITTPDGAKVRMLLPARLDDVGLRIRLKEQPKSDTKDAKDNAPKISQVQTLKIDIDNWFLRIFVPSIEVDFDPATRQILEYRGISDINTDDDKSQQVKVRFTYQ
jgi:hypothetical protein